MTRDFTLWVLLSNIIAWSLDSYFFNLWLRAFVFMIDIIDE